MDFLHQRERLMHRSRRTETRDRKKATELTGMPNEIAWSLEALQEIESAAAI